MKRNPDQTYDLAWMIPCVACWGMAGAAHWGFVSCTRPKDPGGAARCALVPGKPTLSCRLGCLCTLQMDSGCRRWSRRPPSACTSPPSCFMPSIFGEQARSRPPSFAAAWLGVGAWWHPSISATPPSRVLMPPAIGGNIWRVSMPATTTQPHCSGNHCAHAGQHQNIKM
ncbi:hypothetical protein GGTG_11380 [Gaeumannomyces tritici R3-111a-1]|uniref:Uncharacterized protein n=1 Tax=Gaeumannomyces tritici (strain R3-111a-1) TaxID=644352 RepID=J3PD07_GAET3|nr:hypothetical protein GGTG_11380 [Gaeumannomyces tritici R3-111a-1]EJT70352.1 hypothetical protein GGTG_11380 [Gaeumannomyces tritici R3-111a-1]